MLHVPSATPNVIDELDTYYDSSDEIGSTVALSAGTTYYLAIDEWDTVASVFDLRISYP